MNAVRFGFLGAGFVATRAMAPAVHSASGAELYAVASRSTQRAAALQPTTRVYTDYAELIEDEEVDVVYINVVNSLHVSWILRALESGKHVLCEKPLGLTVADAALAFELADRRGLLLVEGIWYRWHPRTRRAEQLLATGSMGLPLSVHAEFSFAGVPHDNYRRDPTLGGGALLDVGCYTLSAVQWSLPGPFRVVAAELVHHVDEVDTSAVATIEAASGQAQVRASIDAAERQSLLITCQRGSLEFSEPAFTSWHERATLTVRQGNSMTTEQFGPVDAYQLMVESMVDRLREAPSWLVEPAESLAVASLVDAVRDRAVPLLPRGPSGDN